MEVIKMGRQRDIGVGWGCRHVVAEGDIHGWKWDRWRFSEVEAAAVML